MLVVVRGDHRLNEIKLQNALGGRSGRRRREEVRKRFGAVPGSSGRSARRCLSWPTRRCAASHGLVAGANEPDVHLAGVEPGRDFEPGGSTSERWRRATADPSGGEIRIEPAIEVGNIFKLGTRYSEPLGARYLDEEGKEQPIWMGSYGIGPARIVGGRDRAVRGRAGDLLAARAGAVRRGAGDAREAGGGAARARRAAVRRAARAGIDVLYDDRDDKRPGEKFADAELLGCPCA